MESDPAQIYGVGRVTEQLFAAIGITVCTPLTFNDVTSTTSAYRHVGTFINFGPPSFCLITITTTETPLHIIWE